MKNLILIPVAALGLAACETPGQTIAASAAAGAAVGGEGDYIEGALIGAAAGATYEYVRQQDDDPQKCLYRNVATGEYRVAPCT